MIDQAKELASQYSGESGTQSKAADYYLKVMNKLSASSDWAQTELARLQKMASKRGAMSGKQLEDLQVRDAFPDARRCTSSLAV